MSSSVAEKQIISDEMEQQVRAQFANYPNKRALLLPVLHLVQQAQRCVSQAAVREIAQLLELKPAEVMDTLSFYGFFKDEQHPLGRRRVWICRSLSCMLRGGDELLSDVCARLQLAPGETTADGNVTIELAECLGACDGAPCILVDDELQLHVTTEDVLALAENRS